MAMRIDDRWSIERDARQWILTERYMGEATTRGGKHYPAREQTKERYFGRLTDAMAYILDRTAGECVTARELRDSLIDAEARLCDCARHMRVADFVGSP